MPPGASLCLGASRRVDALCRRTPIWVAALALVACCLGHALADDPAAGVAGKARPGPSAADLGVRSLDAALEEVRSEHEVPALAGAVVKDGRLFGLGAVGARQAGGESPVELNDAFHIGSDTKSMTATLCAMLVERGKLSWDRTIEDAFPELAGKIRSEYRGVTLEQLLLHRSGLPDDRTPDAVFFKLRGLSGEMRAQRRKLVEIVLSERQPKAKPGAAFEYSNAGYAIAGAMAEQATGRSWEDLMRETLFEPLGMKSAGFGAPGSGAHDGDPFVWGHRGFGGRLAPLRPGPLADNPAAFGPAGSVHCSMRDWAAYALLHLQAAGEKPPAGVDGSGGGKPLLSAESIAKLHADPSGADGYAMGWGVRELPAGGGQLLAHSGSNTMWYAVIQIVPSRGVAVMVATNCGGEAAEKACGEAIRKLRDQYSAR
jgi:CubicO group peptidase (beta-lactamase class C family)